MGVRILTRRGTLGYCSSCEATAANAVHTTDGVAMPDEKLGEGEGEGSNGFGSMADCQLWADHAPEGYTRCCYAIDPANPQAEVQANGVTMQGNGPC